MSITWAFRYRGNSVEVSVDFNTKTMNIYIYIYTKKKLITLFSIGMRLSFYPGMVDVTYNLSSAIYQGFILNLGERVSNCTLLA
jgi:hypothetical protein